MEALILAGGLGTRLSSTVRDVPKVMAPVAGRPFLSYIIDQLKRQGFIHICLAVGHLSKIVSEYFKDGTDFGVKIDYSIEDQPMGTGGAIKKAADRLSNEFLVLNGDSYLDIIFSELISFHTKRHSLTTIALTQLTDTNRYGIVELGQDNRIIAFKEKSLSTGLSLINAGIYVVNKRILADIPGNTPVSFEREILPHYVNSDLCGLKMGGFFVDIGTPSSYHLVRSGFPRMDQMQRHR